MEVLNKSVNSKMIHMGEISSIQTHLVFENSEMEKEFFEKSVFFAIETITEYFSKFPSTITVFLFSSRQAFLESIDQTEAPEWLVAQVPEGSVSELHVFVGQEEVKEKQKETLKQVIVHELAHLFTNQFNSNLPDWLKEGVSVYIAQQIYHANISKKDWSVINKGSYPFDDVSWSEAAEHNGYTIAGLLVMFYVRQYSWSKLLTILESADKEFCFSESFISDFEKEFVN